MVHIAEGALPLWECAAGYAITAAILGLTLYFRRIRLEDVPRVAILSTVFFVASFIHVDVGPSSVHPLLTGLVGIFLGLHSYLGVLIALFLQAVLAGHGGITTLGVNAIDMGVSALIAYAIFRLAIGRMRDVKSVSALCAALGGLAAAIALGLTVLALVVASPAYLMPSIALVLWHVPVVAIETVITGAVVGAILRYKPDVLTYMYGERIRALTGVRA